MKKAHGINQKGSQINCLPSFILISVSVSLSPPLSLPLSPCSFIFLYWFKYIICGKNGVMFYFYALVCYFITFHYTHFINVHIFLAMKKYNSSKVVQHSHAYMFKIKRRGPSIEPCGTPLAILVNKEQLPFM